MKVPHFLVVGAAKSGTTALWKYFQQHPELYVTEDIAYKELGYFSQEYGISNKEEYLSHFKQAKTGQKSGEVCHAYLSDPVSADMIQKENPKCKILIMLRNPAKRAFSLYNWMVMHGYEDAPDFKTALSLEMDRVSGKQAFTKDHHHFVKNYMYFNSGLYAKQVERFLNIFPKNQVQVHLYEDFRKDQPLELSKICSFLEIESFDFKPLQTNVSLKIIDPVKHFEAHKVLRHTPEKGFGKFKIKRAKKMIERNTINNSKPELDSEIYERLIYDYQKDFLKLSELIQTDVTTRWH